MKTGNVMVLAGVFVLTFGQARSQGPQIPEGPDKSQSFEEQLSRLEQKTAADAARIGQNVATAKPVEQPAAPAAQEGAGTLNPADALDEAKVGIAARFIPLNPGQFEMGSPPDEADRRSDETQHTVNLTKGFEMQATEVTQIQYFLVMGRNPSYFRKEENCDPGNFKALYGLGLCPHHPVENLSWGDAQQFISKLNRLQNRYTYRLPTEAEWEYAARGGTPSSFPYSFGFNDTGELDNHGWYKGNSNRRTHAVAAKKPNPWGLYDMHGNVWEWTQDLSRESSHRIPRGGGWRNSSMYLRSANRSHEHPDVRYHTLGFRLVRERR